MKERKQKKCYLLYPEDSIKKNWDMFVNYLLIYTCISTPLFISFHKSNSDVELTNWELVNVIVDIFFGIDIIVVFFSAFYDEDFIITENLKDIARNYIFGWFLLDLCAIIPFDKFNSDSEENDS